jgi:hypothetical protein
LISLYARIIQSSFIETVPLVVGDKVSDNDTTDDFWHRGVNNVVFASILDMVSMGRNVKKI